MVTQGEGGPSSSASLGTSGSQAGEFWFTQATAGILSFYGVTSKVDASTDLATFNTKYPMISYVRYTGETGFGAGTGGGGGGAAADPEQAVTSEPSWSSGSVITSFMDGNVGIGTTSPRAKMDVYHPKASGSSTSAVTSDNEAIIQELKIRQNVDSWDSITMAHNSYMDSDHQHYNILMREDGSLYLGAESIFLIKTGGSERLRILSSGNVGIGTTSPDSKLHVNGNITIDACRTGSSYPTGSVGGGISFRAGAVYAPDSSTGA